MCTLTRALLLGPFLMLSIRLKALPAVEEVSVFDLSGILSRDLGIMPKSDCTMPFSRSAANSTLSAAAFVINPDCPKDKKSLGATILVVDLPDRATKKSARMQKIIKVPEAQEITHLEFYDTSILRIEVKTAEHQYSYSFQNIEDNYHFDLREDIHLPNISAIRHLGRDLYVVHHQSAAPEEFDVTKFSIVRHDPYTREASLIHTLDQPELGWDLLRDEVDLKERTIWRIGGRDIVYRFPHKAGDGHWQEWILTWKNGKFSLLQSIELGSGFADPVHYYASTVSLAMRELRIIQGTDRYFQDDDPEAVFVFETDVRASLVPHIQFLDALSDISLTLVSGPSANVAFLGVDESGNHYLFAEDQVIPLTSKNKLSLISYQDGGFLGVRRRDDGYWVLRRHIYNQEALARVQIPIKTRRDCSSLVSSASGFK